MNLAARSCSLEPAAARNVGGRRQRATRTKSSASARLGAFGACIVVAGLGVTSSGATAHHPARAQLPPIQSRGVIPVDPGAAIYEQPSDRISVRTYTPTDGIPAPELRDIEIDQDGFVWIATIGGLAKFDGHQFTAYEADPKRPDALPQFVVENLASDPVQGMWAAAGVMVHANSVDFDGKGSAIERTDITAVRMNRADKLIWVWAPEGMKLFDPASRSVLMETPIDIEPLDSYSVQIAAVSDSLAVVGGTDGLWVVHANGETSSHPTKVPVRDTYPSQFNGKVWVLDDERLSLYDPSTDELEPVVERIVAHPDLPKAPVTSGGLIERADGTVWIATELGGVEVYVPAEDRLHVIPPGRGGTGLAAKVDDFYEDAQGGMWLSAFGVGVQYLPAGLPPVWSAGMPKRADGSEIIDTYLDLEVVDNRVWAASDGGGLHTYDVHSGTFGEPITTENSDLPSDSVIGLARRDDELWIGMWDGAITRYSLTTGRFSPLETVDEGGPVLGVNVFDIESGPDDTMWAAIWGVGVQVFNGDGTPQRTFGPDGDVKIDGTLVIDIVPDHEGATWLSGWSGVERVDQRTGEVDRWSMETGELLGDIVFDLHFGDDGTVWVATSAGLEHLDPATGITSYFGRSQNVPGPAVIQIVPVPGRNAVWLATADRLAEFDLSTERVVQTFGLADGLPAGGFGRYGNDELADGVIVISTNDGLAFARGSDVPYHDPPVYVSAMSVDDQRRSFETGAVQMSVDAIRLTVSFTGIDHRQPDGMTYEYRLVGLENDWVRSSEQTATYSRLAPGQYRFEVRARTASGVLSSRPATLSITVVPHWWQTLAARLLGIAAFALVIVAGIVWTLRRARRRNRELERMVADRTVELERQTAEARAANAAKSVFVSNVSHELRNPLQSVLGLAELLSLSAHGRQQQKWAEQIHTSGSDLLSMIEELLELSSLESSATPLRVSRVDLRRLVEEIVEGLGSAPSTRQRILGSIELTNDVVWCDSRRLRQVLANLTLNAVRYSAGDNVVVAVRESRADNAAADDASPAGSIRGYRFSVRDEGPGMSPEEVAVAFEPFVRGRRAVSGGAGLGLAISRQLVSRLGGRLSVETAPDSPTEFYFELDLRVGSTQDVAVDSDPAGDEPGDGHRRSSPRQEASVPRLEQLRAIIVEPDPPARQALADALTLLGVQVESHETGSKALAAADRANDPIDLFVISDRLPDLEPSSVVQRLRSIDNGHRSAVLLSSGQPGSVAMFEGLDGCLRKPISLSDLVDALQTFGQVEMV